MLFDDIIVTVEGRLELCVTVISAAHLFLIVIMDKSEHIIILHFTAPFYNLAHLFSSHTV